MATRTAVRILAACYARGYSNRDHLLDDSDFDPVRGRVFPNRKAAEEAAEACNTSSTSPTRIEFAADVVPTVAEIEPTIDRALERHPNWCLAGGWSRPFQRGDYFEVGLQDDSAAPVVGVGHPPWNRWIRIR